RKSTVCLGSFSIIQTKGISSHARPVARSRACRSGAERERYCPEMGVPIGFQDDCALKPRAIPEVSRRTLHRRNAFKRRRESKARRLMDQCADLRFEPWSGSRHSPAAIDPKATYSPTQIDGPHPLCGDSDALWQASNLRMRN